MHEVSSMSQLECPACKAVMSSHEVETYLVYGCDKCGGAWCDSETTRLLSLGVNTEEHRQVAAIIDKGSAVLDSAGGVYREQITVRRCPECGSPLHEIDVQGTKVDICPAHGTYFDPKELQEMVASFEQDDIDSTLVRAMRTPQHESQYDQYERFFRSLGAALVKVYRNLKS